MIQLAQGGEMEAISLHKERRREKIFWSQTATPDLLSFSLFFMFFLFDLFCYSSSSALELSPVISVKQNRLFCVAVVENYEAVFFVSVECCARGFHCLMYWDVINKLSWKSIFHCLVAFGTPGSLLKIWKMCDVMMKVICPKFLFYANITFLFNVLTTYTSHNWWSR